MSLLDYASFLNEQLILERDITKKQQPFFTAYAKEFPKSPEPRNTKTREIIRARFGLDGKEAEGNIKKLFANVGLNVDSVLAHMPGAVKDGNKLGSSIYYTYEVKVGKETYWVTNSTQTSDSGGKVEIGKKMLTPATLGLSGKYTSNTELAEAAKGSINALSWMTDQTKKLISHLIDAAVAVKPKFATAKEFFESSTNSSVIKYDAGNISLDAKSQQNLVNDFGEVLDGIYVLGIIRNIKDGLVFPEEANKPLLDIECDGYMISAKDIKGGGSPSAAPIINSLKAGDIPLDEKEKELAAILLAASGKSVYDQYMLISDALFSRKYLGSDSAYGYLLSKMNLTSHPEKKNLETFLDSLEEKEYNELVDEMYKRSGRGKSDVPRNAKRIGPIFATITKECGDCLNNNFQETFSAITTKVVSLKQIYMTVEISKDSMKFVTKPSEEMQAKFDTSKSTPNNPFNAGVSFKFLKGRK